MAAATRTGFLLFIALVAGVHGALAQGTPVPAGIDHPLEWRLDSGPAKPAGRKAARSAGKPVAKPGADDAAERAARLAERRRKFFDSRPDDQGADKIPEFGGYDASKMGNETVHPGATFKF